MSTQKIEDAFRISEDEVCSVAKNGMVASASAHATRAGARILEEEGNAVDSAVATALALCVSEPQASGIGGQSSALICFGGKVLFLDGSGTIPRLYRNELIAPIDMQVGYRGTTTPTTLSLLFRMHERFGHLPWREVVAPAVNLAKTGFRITQLQHDLLSREADLFASVTSRSGAKYFYKNGEQPYEAGDLFVQADLADVLDRISNDGLESFYKGDIAAAIDRDMKKNDGFLRREDLADIPYPVERDALDSTVFGKRIITTTPPSQGRLLLMALKLAERLLVAEKTTQSPRFLNGLAEIFCEVYRERMENPLFPDSYSADKDFVLNDTGRMTALYENILDGSQTSKNPVGLQGGETTHLSVMDGKGNAVGITQSVNMVYGSKSAAEGLGFIYNNYLIDSYLLPENHPYAPVAGGFAPTSIAPFIIMENGKPWLIAGSPGSQRIVTALTQFLVHILAAGLPIDQAMAMPRFHCERHKHIILEEGRFEDSIIRKLQGFGVDVTEKSSFYVGAVHAVLKCQHDDRFQGVADMRRDGIAAGPSQ